MGLEMTFNLFKKLASSALWVQGKGAIGTLTIMVHQLVMGKGAVGAPAKVSSLQKVKLELQWRWCRGVGGRGGRE